MTTFALICAISVVAVFAQDGEEMYKGLGDQRVGDMDVSRHGGGPPPGGSRPADAPDKPHMGNKLTEECHTTCTTSSACVSLTGMTNVNCKAAVATCGGCVFDCMIARRNQLKTAGTPDPEEAKRELEDDAKVTNSKTKTQLEADRKTNTIAFQKVVRCDGCDIKGMARTCHKARRDALKAANKLPTKEFELKGQSGMKKKVVDCDAITCMKAAVAADSSCTALKAQSDAAANKEKAECDVEAVTLSADVVAAELAVSGIPAVIQSLVLLLAALMA